MVVKGGKGVKYDVHPSVAMMQDWIAGLKGKTGRTLDQWVSLVKKEGPSGEETRGEWLKKEHGFGTNAAAWLAERAEGGKAGTWDENPEVYLAEAAAYVEAMYAGKKAALRPI